MVSNKVLSKIAKMGIDVEYASGNYPLFRKKVEGKNVAVLCDRNTKKYAEKLDIDNKDIVFIDSDEPVPDEAVCDLARKATVKNDFILAVGSGTLNDVAKNAAFFAKKQSGILCTAPSMDGYASSVSAVIRDGFKYSDVVNAPSNILIDGNILKDAPSIMIAAGTGDILGKFSCLTDWMLSHYHNGEKVNQVAFDDMQNAVDDVVNAIPDIINRSSNGLEILTDALVVSGMAISENGNSRPASGSEHHISHYLEMYFIKNKLHVPLHGVKVGLGTLVTSYLYSALERDNVDFKGAKETYEFAKYIPSLDFLKNTLSALKAPIKFSDLDISKDVFVETLKNAYTVRDRYTVLTLMNELKLMDKYIPELVDLFY